MKEAAWLEQKGCDAIIAQGFEAGGHRGTFLSDTIATQVGAMALVPQLADTVRVPVIAARGHRRWARHRRCLRTRRFRGADRNGLSFLS